MRLRELRHDQIHAFYLQGEADLHSVAVLRALFSAKSDWQCPALVVDFSGVTFIDSTGIAVLLEYLRDSRAYEGAFCITGPTERLRHIFKIVGLDKVMSIFPTVAEAVASLSKAGAATDSRRFSGAAYQPTLSATA